MISVVYLQWINYSSPLLCAMIPFKICMECLYFIINWKNKKFSCFFASYLSLASVCSLMIKQLKKSGWFRFPVLSFNDPKMLKLKMKNLFCCYLIPFKNFENQLKLFYVFNGVYMLSTLWWTASLMHIVLGYCYMVVFCLLHHLWFWHIQIMNLNFKGILRYMWTSWVKILKCKFFYTSGTNKPINLTLTRSRNTNAGTIELTGFSICYKFLKLRVILLDLFFASGLEALPCMTVKNNSEFSWPKHFLSIIFCGRYFTIQYQFLRLLLAVAICFYSF